MSWSDLPKPDGVREVRETESGFEASISIPTDEDGFFGRECPICHAPFKLRDDQYEALPEEAELTCPYCGHQEEHGGFVTSAQEERATAAAAGLAEQWLHREIGSIFGGAFGGDRPRSSSSSFSVSMRYTPGAPPLVSELPEGIEAQTRRLVECSTCGTQVAVFSVTAYCPICGPRPTADTVQDAIAAARGALLLEDGFDVDQREELRAIGVLERFAVDAVESVVALFEMFAREQFSQRDPDAATHTRAKGNVFQRLDDAAKLFAEHADIDLAELAGPERWARLKRAFAQRHVLTHNGGIVDVRFLEQVPDSPLRLGQRVIVSRGNAELALDDLEAVVRTLASS